MPVSAVAPPGAVSPKVLTLPEAAAWLQGQGVAVTAEAVRQWITSGGWGPGRQRVRLRSYWIGGRHYTRRKWLREYVALVTAGRVPPTPEPAARTESPDATAERFRREKEELAAKLQRRKPTAKRGR